jgi:hypothetical protein
MAIMVAGGLTFAVPGADPVFAEVSTSNPHLYVSAEGQDPDNMFAEGNIIEVIVRDDTIGDTDEGEAEPEVTINGADLRMLQTANGYWTAYFAEVDALADIESLDYGVYCGEADASAVTGLQLSDGSGVYLPPGSDCSDPSAGNGGHPLIREPRGLTNHDGKSLGQLGLSGENLWPFIQVYDFTSLADVEIVYNRGGTQESVTLTFDDPSESHTLDRQKYPQRAHVQIELTDYALNIDPTDEDTWVFDTRNGAAYYNVFDEDGNPVNAMHDEISSVGPEAGIDETVSIVRGAQGNDVIDCQVTKDFGIRAADDPSRDYLVSDDSGACVPNEGKLGAGADAVFAPGNFAIGFVEDGSNNNRFVNWAEDQRSNLVVTKDAPRGNSFEVDYSSPDAKSGVVGHFFAELSLDVPDGVWNSGERIPVVLTDGDANVNPLAEDDLAVADPYSLLVPSIRIGSPVTLASADGDVVWYDLEDPRPPDETDPVIRLNGMAEVRLNKGNDYMDKGATCNDARDGSITPIQTSNTVDTTSAGSYKVMYSCTDAAGNTATATRTVTVDDPGAADTTDPVITVNPGADTITAGDRWNDAGASCTDARDGNLDVTMSSAVDNTKAGTHTITYTCTDDAGNSATETRTVTVTAKLASISLRVVPGDWNNGVLVLEVSGTAVNVDDGTVMVSSDTISDLGGSVKISNNKISGEVVLVNFTVSGLHNFTATSSDGATKGTTKAHIPNALSLTSVTSRGGWAVGDEGAELELIVRGSESVPDSVYLSILDEDGKATQIGAITFADNEARVNATNKELSTDKAVFVLTSTYAGAEARSDSVTAPYIPELLTLDKFTLGEWADGELTFNVTGEWSTVPVNDDNVELQVLGGSSDEWEAFGGAEAIGNMTFRVTASDTDMAGLKDAKFRLAIDGMFFSNTVTADIPPVLALDEVRLAGTWSGDPLTLSLQISGSERVAGEDVDLYVNGEDSDIDVNSQADGSIAATVSFDDVSISGPTKFQLASGNARSQNVTVDIPPVLTLSSVGTVGSWDNGEIDLRIAGTTLLTTDLYLVAPDIDGVMVPITAAGDDPIVSDGGDIDGTVQFGYLGINGNTTFRLEAGKAVSQNQTVDIPPVLELTELTTGSWTGDAGGESITLSVQGASGLPSDAMVTLQWATADGTFTSLDGSLPVANDGSIFGSVSTEDLRVKANSSLTFRLTSDVVGNTVVSANMTRALPAAPNGAGSSSVDMVPTPISSQNIGFPPITRAVINDISEIPDMHNVALKAISSDKKVAHTWSGSDKITEQYSDRLRLYEPKDMKLDVAVTGGSAVVVNGWKLPEFQDGVTTMFNWNVESLADHAAVKAVYIANDTHKLLLSEEASGLMHLDEDKQSSIEDMGTGDAMLIVTLDGDVSRLCSDIVLVADFFAFGQTPEGDRVNDAIYRIEVEEASSNSDTFEGTVEYVMLNQLNIDDPGTYAGLRPVSDQVSMIVHEDFTDEDSVRVNYLDLGADGVPTQVAVQQAAPTHSAVVSFDSESYKVADTVTITVEDADLNVDSDVIDIYTFSASDDLKDHIGDDKAYILDVTFDDELWTSGKCQDGGFESTGFTLMETASDSGVFTGDFQIPEKYCQSSTGKMVSVTGVDIEVNYQDFRDASGEEIEVGAGAAVRANTGTVSLDRTVYPVPFKAGVFEHANGALKQHDLTVHVTIDDPDFDMSAAGEDAIPNATKYLTVQVIRGSASHEIDLGSADILETAPDSGAFELDLGLAYDDGPDGKILQGDILQVEYRDPTDASGEENTVTDSATFDLRNGVLQSDKSVYIIGSDMILTLIEPDLDLDNDGAESYTLDLIEWDSDAGTLGMNNAAFDPEPSELRETGDSTGIFQVIAEIPAAIGDDRLERGEEIELEYVDWGPSGADHVGDESEDVGLTVYTSNFGATIELDQKVYTWTDKVYITIVAPDHNFDSALVDEIGESDSDPIQVSTRSADIDNYKLVETGPDTGIFTGEVILVGFDHNADGDTETGTGAGYDNPQRGTSPDESGPTNGYLETDDDDGITVSFEYSEDETVVGSALIRWNIGEVQWLESSYPASGTGVVRVIDPDMNWNPEAVNNFVVDVWSDADNGGIDLTVTETNEATGIFEGTVFFTITDESSGHRLRVAEGNTVTAEYEDNTLPDPYTTADELDITATTLIGTIVPPLERAPATNLRIVDAFGNSLDTVSAGQQVQIVADLANGQDRSQAFAYLVQVQDSNGVTVALSWISGTLEAGQSLSPSTSWIPSDAGAYAATAFVWESVDNPTALSPPVTTDIAVS